MVDNARTCLNRKPATFQFYLNDLFGNDFNTIFKSLPDFYTRLVEDNGHKNETPRRSLREVISLTLNDMLLEVLIEDEKLDSFNIPVYEPTVEEIRHVILEEESLFLQRLDIFTMSWDEGINDSFLDGNIRAEFVAKYTRAVMERLFYLQSSRQKL
ncbi:3,7-dimethylxanthine N-methyltransferase-like [Glycine soja]|uniref:3,7-dimethylxanthine N-methyltransferase-like n=1 Tax=Glycine soja TaxID=3848 RepID=UPI00103AE079|nr:3,7-dimethylxanthine N-methyltransferase-like [Glycine soja]